MILRDKFTEIFCMADDFCKLYDRFIKANGLAPKRDKSKRKYHRDPKMSSAEIITIMILFHLSGYKYFKHFYINEIQGHMSDMFPKTVAYNRFTELERTVVIPFIPFVKRCCMGKCTGISFVDSTLLRVCRNQRIHMHKVFKGIAQRGQCSMGWLYGFKLHLICNEMGELLSFMVTPGNVDDREPLKNKTFVEQLFVDGIQLITKLRNNMKGQIMTLGDKILLRKRAIIETINDELKNIAQIEHSRHQSLTGFTVNPMAGLAAYSFFPKKPMIAVERVEPQENEFIQLSLF